MTAPRGLDRPIRVVLFCGPVLERAVALLVQRLERHPEVEFLGGFCQTQGLGWGHRVRDLWRRRGVLAVPLLAVAGAGSAARWLAAPRREWRIRTATGELLERLVLVPDIHAGEVLAEVRGRRPDLGLIYGGPILKPELFQIPTLGTLGIHHGKVPEYRGKKTAFWALYNGEATAGVTIQRVNAGIDTGDLVRTGEVPARGRSYRAVSRDVERLGIELYLHAILDVKRGEAVYRPQTGVRGRLYRDPRPADLVRYYLRRLRTSAPAATGSPEAARRT